MNDYLTLTCILFVVVTIFFVIYLIRDYDDNFVVKKNVSFNDEIEMLDIPGRESIDISLNNTNVVNKALVKKNRNVLDEYLDDTYPLQKETYNVEDEKPVFDYENKYLVEDYPKDNLKGYSEYSNLSSFSTIPQDKDDFSSSTGKFLEGEDINETAKFDNDVELTYNEWFQGKTPREFIPNNDIVNPKFAKELKHKQQYTSVGEWEYKNESNMNTGSTGTNITGYSDYHNGVGLYNNKLEISKCNN